jgi:hypothetical protein
MNVPIRWTGLTTDLAFSLWMVSAKCEAPPSGMSAAGQSYAVIDRQKRAPSRSTVVMTM